MQDVGAGLPSAGRAPTSPANAEVDVRRSPSSPLFLILLLLSVATLASSGCGRRGAAQRGDESGDAVTDSTGAAAGEEDEDTAVPVEVVVVDSGPMESVISSSATIEAESEIDVVAEAARRVEERLVEEGDHVKAGDLLLRLQDDEQRSNLQKAETMLDTARREFERQQRLMEQELTTEKALNEARSTFEQRQVDYDDAKRELSYTEVRAPIQGTVVERLVNVGDQVNLGAKLFRIVDFSSLIAYVYIPEKDLQRLRVDQPARVRAPALGDREYDCRVKRVSPIVDARSGTIKVTVGIGDQPGLRPGLYVDVDVITDVRKDAVRVPKRAIVYGEDQLFVFRIGKGRVARRALLVPELEDQSYVVPAAGIAVGDTLVTAGQAGLKDGAKVRVVDRDRDGETASDAATEAAQS
jgi:membrane fusion protein (multidrug efflux system)